MPIFIQNPAMPDFIYLASQSPRRRQLLGQLGVRHELLLPNVEGDEAEDAEAIEVVMPGEAPMAYVERVTALKLDAAVARRARRQLPDAPILCSDTTVALGRTIYGKPDDAAHAARMLAELAGHEHRVLTAVALQVGAKRLTAPFCVPAGSSALLAWFWLKTRPWLPGQPPRGGFFAALLDKTAASSYAAASRSSKVMASVGQTGRQSPRPSQ